jgi:hypothetical protein
MRLRATLATLSVWLVAVSFLSLGGGCGHAATMTLEVQLLWGTDAAQSPNPGHKPVEPDVKKKLDELPLKWPHWYEVNRKRFKVPPRVPEPVKVPLSEKCAIEVKNLGEANVEVGLFGKGNQVVRRIQKLPKGELVVFGGKAPNATAWLVVLKRLE